MAEKLRQCLVVYLYKYTSWDWRVGNTTALLAWPSDQAAVRNLEQAVKTQQPGSVTDLVVINVVWLGD